MADQARVTIRVVPDTKGFARDLRTFLERIEKTMSAEIKVKADVDKAGVKNIDRVDRSIKRVTTSSKKAESAFGKLFAALGGTAKARGVGIVALGVSAAAAAPAIARFVAALAPAAGIIVALPAAALGAAAAIGTLKLALSGVSETIEAGLTGDMDAFNEGLKNLSPSARAFAKEVVRLRPQLDALRKSVQEKFFAGFVTEFRGLATKILPVLNTQLTRIAGSLGGFAENFARAAQGSVFVGGLNSVLASTADSLAVLNNAVGPLTDAFGRLFSVASPLLTRIATSTSTSLTNFSALVKRLDESGKLATILANAVTVIGQVFQIIKNVGATVFTIFQNLGTGAGSLLDNLVQLTASFRAFVSSAEGATAIRNLAGALTQIGTIIRSLIGSLGPGITALLGGLKGGFTALAPVAKTVGTAISDIAVAIAPLLPLIGRLLAAALEPLATILSGMVKAIAPFVTILAETLVSALEQLLPAFTEIANFLLPYIAAGFKILTDFVRPLIPLIVELTKEFAEGFVKGVKDLKPVLDQMLPGLKELGSFLLPIIISGLKSAIPAMQLLGRAFGFIVGSVAIALNALALVGIVIGGISTIVRKVASDLTLAWNKAKAVTVSVWNGIAAAVGSAVNRVVGVVRGISRTVTGIFGGAGSWLVNAGRQIIEGLIRGINNALGKLRSTLNKVTSLIPDWKGPAATDRKLLTPNGRLIMDGLNAGINDGAQETRRLLQGLTSTIGSSPIGVGGAALASSGPSVVVAKFGNKELYGLVEDAVNERPERFALAVSRGQSSVRNRSGRL